MPVTKPKVGLFDISNLKIESTNDGYALSLVCPRAEAYVLCFSKGDKPIKCEELMLSEEELRNLYTGTSRIQRENCRLQGVTSNAFHAMSYFKNFSVDPPERIQVWSMTCNEYGHATLYIPENEAVCYVPLPYSISLDTENAFTMLTVNIKKSDNYTDGALMYQVGEYDPIPIPRAWIGRQIKLKISDINCVKVVVQELYSDKYKLVKNRQYRY